MQTKQPPQIPFVDLTAQYRTIAAEINETTSRVIQEADFILGREVRLFEEEFAAFCEARYAVGLDSGTSALELALRAYDIGPGDEVITAANSFIASALAISHAGATPVLVDVDPFTYTIDVTGIERAITSRTKAILPVHLYGHPAHMDPIRQLAEQRGLIVIEDACQAHGARYKGRRAGSLGHAAAFSFYPGKNLGAYGDGGMVVTNDADIAKRLEMLRNYGQKEKYHHLSQGFNRRLDTLQAAVLRVKLKYLEKWNAARRWQAELYHRLLAGTEIVLPSEAVGAQSVWHLYVIRSEHRDALKEHLASRGIAAGIHYPVPIHLQPAYKNLGYKRGDFPVTEQYAQRILSLPMYAELTPELIDCVAESILSFLSANQNGHGLYEQLVRQATPSSL
jgi:dTDP-4-amino-4,6-dideoxygalactose transaminase